MKIAKKVLAVAMAVAMIACFAAMAFAATPTEKTAYTIVATESEDYDVSIVLSIENGAGFKSGGVIIKYDPTVLEYQEFLPGADVDKMDSFSKGNSFTPDANGDEIGVIDSEFYFKENLWTAAEFLANKKPKATQEDIDSINVNNFAMVSYEFMLKDGKTIDDVVVSLEAKNAAFIDDAGKDMSYNEIKCNGVEKKEPATEAPTEAPTEAHTEAPTEAPTKAPASDEPTTAAGATDNKGPQGDTGVLALAAGVVAVAGAAFVVSKKRK